MVRFGSFGRVTPIQRGFDHDRGQFIDRYYIDQFLQQRSNVIRGHVLEIGDDIYTRLFGGSQVASCDILDVRSYATEATIIGDLTSPGCLAANTYDCAIVTQTLNYIYDVQSAMRTLVNALRPGGALLVTVSGIAQIAPEEMRYCGDFWRFTSVSLRRLLEEFFPSEQVEVVPYGNVLSAVSFLHGLGSEELKKEDLDFNDPEYQLVICALAVKPVIR
jgi:methyltransferase family protein